VARVAAAFGMQVLAFDRFPPLSTPAGVRLADLDTVFRDSDVVSLHCPLTADNRELINAARLALMKPTAYVVNTARGGLVNDADLAQALNEGRLAWATRAARARLIRSTVANIRAFLDGQPINVVNR
jgi:glycerate dehydrogenase